MRCSSPGSVLRVGEAVAQAPGLGAGVDDVRAVGEAVNDGFGEPGVGEHLGPFTERQVRRDDSDARPVETDARSSGSTPRYVRRSGSAERHEAQKRRLAAHPDMARDLSHAHGVSPQGS